MWPEPFSNYTSEGSAAHINVSFVASLLGTGCACKDGPAESSLLTRPQVELAEHWLRWPVRCLQNVRRGHPCHNCLAGSRTTKRVAGEDRCVHSSCLQHRSQPSRHRTWNYWLVRCYCPQEQPWQRLDTNA